MEFRLAKTAWGWAAAVGKAGAVRRLYIAYPSRPSLLKDVLREFGAADESRGAFGRLVETLRAYFKGERVEWLDIPTDLTGTPFQKKVWRTAMAIPYGETRTYGWIARQVGAPGASRAVGNALGRNPVPLIVPCHRVVRSDGSLGGFSAKQGVALKKRLLRLEQAL